VAPTPMRQQETIMMEWSEEEARPQRRRRSLAQKKKATKDMVSRWSDGDQGCSEDVRY
jgi:hypothetical protein